MRELILLVLLILIVGCSDKSSNLQEKNTKYQNFLSQKSDKTLEKELERYEK